MKYCEMKSVFPSYGELLDSKVQCMNPFTQDFVLLQFRTHPLDLARFYWLLYVTWCKITGQLSRNNPRPRRYLSSDFFRAKKTHNQHKSFNFSVLLFTWKEAKLVFFCLLATITRIRHEITTGFFCLFTRTLIAM